MRRSLKSFVSMLLTLSMISGMSAFTAIGADDVYVADDEAIQAYAYDLYTSAAPIYTGATSTSVDGSITGEIFGNSSEAYVGGTNAIFDGNPTTEGFVWPDNDGVEITGWIGVKTAYPVIPTSFRLATLTGETPRSKIMNTYFQGSNDGTNWTTLHYIENTYTVYNNYSEWPDGGYKTIALNIDASYTYFRFFGMEVTKLTEVQIFGTEIKPSTLDYYSGDIYYSGVTVAGQNDSLGGEVISGVNKVSNGNILDGNVSTHSGSTNVDESVSPWVPLALDNWVGIDAKAAYVPTKVRVSAPATVSDTLWSLYIQGSNDGRNWDTLKGFTQDDYVAYDAVMASEPYYEAVIDTTTAYRYYRAIKDNDTDTRNCISELEIHIIKSNTIDVFNGTVVATGYMNTPTGGAVSGQIIGGGVTYAEVSAFFDGNHTTQGNFSDNVGTNVDHWVGLKLATAVVPTGFRLATASGQRSKIIGSYIQGSNDGINWVTLKEYESGDQWREYTAPSAGGYWFDEAPYKYIEVDTTEAYQYYRYFNYNGRGANRLTEFQVFTNDGATEGAISNVLKFHGEIKHTNMNSTSVDGSLVGEMIGGGTSTGLTSFADGDTATTWAPASNATQYVDYWAGISFPAPVSVSSIKVSAPASHNLFGSYIQGSNDGINWETIMHFNSYASYSAFANGWLTVSASGTYTYFRYFNDADIGSNKLNEFHVYGTHTHAMAYTAAADATCAAVGNVEYYYCSACETYFADEAGNTVLTTLETAINPDNHAGGTEIRDAVDATADSEGYTGDTWCLGCETKIADGQATEKANTLYVYNGTISDPGRTQTKGYNPSLLGDIIRGGGDVDDAFYNAFNWSGGSGINLGVNTATAADNWVGVKFNAPVVATKFLVSTMGMTSNINEAYVQGSNDGITWVNLTEALSYTSGNFYYPTTGDTNAYTYFRYICVDGSDYLDEFIVYGTASVTNTLEQFNGVMTWNNRGSNAVVSSNGSISGTFIGTVPVNGQLWDMMTDGDYTSNGSVFDVDGKGSAFDAWFGIKANDPVVPGKFRVVIENTANIAGAHIQGSNDGINWTTLVAFDSDPGMWTPVANSADSGASTKDFYVETETAYTYFRYINAVDSSRISLREFQVFEATTTNTLTKFVGTADITIYGGATTVTPSNGSIGGTIIGDAPAGGYMFSSLVDGDYKSGGSAFDAAAIGGPYDTWFGIQADAPVVPGKFRVVMSKTNIENGDANGAYIQASEDGVNWITMAALDTNGWTESDGAYVQDFNVETETAYTYFRYINAVASARISMNEFQVFAAVDPVVDVLDSEGNVIGSYATVEEAIATLTAEQTLKLTADVEVANLAPEVGTIDLNGFNLTAGAVTIAPAADVSIVDTSEDNSGLLVCAADQVMLSADNAQLPVWNGTNGYRFFDFNIKTQIKAVEGKDNTTFRFYFDKALDWMDFFNYLGNGAADNNVTIGVRFTFDGGSIDAKFDDSLVVLLAQQLDGGWAVGRCNLINVSAKANLKYSVVIKSTTTGAEYVVDAAN